jgi:hypothetical protein
VTPEVATQLVTVVGTLGGVVLTLASTTYLERRRARDSRESESRRLAAEHAAWLRDQRVKAYAGLSLAGEEVLQFIRNDLPTLVAPGGHQGAAAAETRWRELRTDLRKAYNQVELFGAEVARAGALLMWRTARNGGNDFLRQLTAGEPSGGTGPDLLEQIRAVAAELGTVGDRFLQACRTSLQAPENHQGK